MWNDRRRNLGRRTAIVCALLLPTAFSLQAADKPQPQTTLTGLVVDPQGTAVAGVQVEVVSSEEKATATSDGEGRFSIHFGTLQARFGAVIVHSDDDRKMGFFRLPFEEDELAQPVEVTLKPSRRITIEVNDADGQPIAGARAGVIAGRFSMGSRLTGDDGQAAIDVPQDAPPNFVYAWKAATGFDYHTLGDGAAIATPADGQDEVRPAFSLVLSNPITVEVKLVDGVEGLPLPGIPMLPVRIEKAGEAADFGLFYLKDQLRVETNVQGVASFDWLPGWNQTEALQFAPFSERHVVKLGDYKPANKSGRFTMSLEERVPIRGQVRLPNGKPAAGIGVYAAGRGSEGAYFSGWEKTDEEGRYEFLAAPKQDYLVYVTDDEWAAVPHAGLAVFPGEPIENMDFDLRPATRVFGQVTSGPDNEPVAGYNVNIEQYGVKVDMVDGKPVPNPRPQSLHRLPSHQRSTKTDSDGVFEYFVGPGTFQLYQKSQTVDFTITDEREREFSFKVPHAASSKLVGSVVAGRPPQPIPRAIVLGTYRAESNQPRFTRWRRSSNYRSAMQTATLDSSSCRPPAIGWPTKR